MVNLDSKRLESMLYFLIGMVAIVIVNQISARLFHRFDLTEEKRYTISDATREMLRDLDDIVYIEVYLEGDLPASVRRLQNSVRETLNEFKVHGGSNIQFRFINPATAKTAKARQQYYESLADKGIQPTNLYDNVDGKRTQILVFPGALLTYGTKQSSVNFLKGNKSSSPEEQLNQSIEGLEYELANSIQSLVRKKTGRIALLKGHGELDSVHIAGLKAVLGSKYQVVEADLTKRPNLLGFDAMVLAKPSQTFSESDKYKIDQFIMRGGKAMFLIDALQVSMDSAGTESNLALPFESNLDDLFFKYGFRVTAA
jgi:ABC-2 type transport system permease protein